MDLFAGAGGFSLAAIQANLEVVAAVEFDKAATTTYRNNISKAQKKPVKLYAGDILKLNPNDILKDGYLDSHGCDLVLGGPPCQGFSAHRINDAGVDDKRNKLILHYFKFVSSLQSKVFLMENVPGILWKKHRSYLNEFYKQGKKAGYHIFPPVTLDARDYGIPQRRKRVFILGIRKDISKTDIAWPPSATHGDKKEIQKNPQLKPWVASDKIFSFPLNLEDENNVHMNHKPELVEVFRSTPPNGGSRNESNRILPCHKEHNGHSDVYGRIDSRQPGPTMTTACVNPSKGRFLHPTENHGITARHAARFQTFPDWYTFHGGLMASARQIGNAVPVEFGKILINNIKFSLKKYYLKKR